MSQIPAFHFKKNLECLHLKTFLSDLASRQLCLGVTDSPLQEYANLPTNSDSVDKYFLHALYKFELAEYCCITTVRSRECLLLSEDTKLPGESTQRDYTNYIHPQTGFQREVVEDIRCAAEKLGDHQKYVVLLHDEMSIKEDLVLDNGSQEVVGFANMQNWQMYANCSNRASLATGFLRDGDQQFTQEKHGILCDKNCKG